jgi:hypothetical protein
MRRKVVFDEVVRTLCGQNIPCHLLTMTHVLNSARYDILAGVGCSVWR